MPRFDFDTADGVAIRDKAGMEFEDVHEAGREAVISVGEMMQDVLRRGDDRSQKLVVLDESRTPLFKAAVRFDVQNLS